MKQYTYGIRQRGKKQINFLHLTAKTEPRGNTVTREIKVGIGTHFDLQWSITESELRQRLQGLYTVSADIMIYGSETQPLKMEEMQKWFGDLKQKGRDI